MSTKEIRREIVSTLRGIDGTGAYLIKLSGTGQVESGKFDQPPATVPRDAAFGCVYTNGIDEDDLQVPTNMLRSTTHFMVTVWVPARAHLPEARQDAADDAFDSVRAAFRANPTLGGKVIKLFVSMVSMTADGSQGPQQRSWGILLANITTIHREAR